MIILARCDSCGKEFKLRLAGIIVSVLCQKCQDDPDLTKVNERLEERLGTLLTLFNDVLKAVAPTHTYWIEANPDLVRRIREAGFEVKEW
jgi:hypothetical protein